MEWLFKALWVKKDVTGCRLNMVDTIFLEHGVPYLWLFTNKSGVVKRKNSPNCNLVTAYQTFSRYANDPKHPSQFCAVGYRDPGISNSLRGGTTLERTPPPDPSMIKFFRQNNRANAPLPPEHPDPSHTPSEYEIFGIPAFQEVCKSYHEAGHYLILQKYIETSSDYPGELLNEYKLSPGNGTPHLQTWSLPASDSMRIGSVSQATRSMTYSINIMLNKQTEEAIRYIERSLPPRARIVHAVLHYLVDCHGQFWLVRASDLQTDRNFTCTTPLALFARDLAIDPADAHPQAPNLLTARGPSRPDAAGNETARTGARGGATTDRGGVDHRRDLDLGGDIDQQDHQSRGDSDQGHADTDRGHVDRAGRWRGFPHGDVDQHYQSRGDADQGHVDDRYDQGVGDLDQSSARRPPPPRSVERVPRVEEECDDEAETSDPEGASVTESDHTRRWPRGFVSTRVVEPSPPRNTAAEEDEPTTGRRTARSASAAANLASAHRHRRRPNPATGQRGQPSPPARHRSRTPPSPGEATEGPPTGRTADGHTIDITAPLPSPGTEIFATHPQGGSTVLTAAASPRPTGTPTTGRSVLIDPNDCAFRAMMHRLLGHLGAVPLSPTMQSVAARGGAGLWPGYVPPTPRGVADEAGGDGGDAESTGGSQTARCRGEQQRRGLVAQEGGGRVRLPPLPLQRIAGSGDGPATASVNTESARHSSTSADLSPHHRPHHPGSSTPLAQSSPPGGGAPSRHLHLHPATNAVTAATAAAGSPLPLAMLQAPTPHKRKQLKPIIIGELTQVPSLYGQVVFPVAPTPVNTPVSPQIPGGEGAAEEEEQTSLPSASPMAPPPPPMPSARGVKDAPTTSFSHTRAASALARLQLNAAGFMSRFAPPATPPALHDHPSPYALPTPRIHAQAGVLKPGEYKMSTARGQLYPAMLTRLPAVGITPTRTLEGLTSGTFRSFLDKLAATAIPPPQTTTPRNPTRGRSTTPTSAVIPSIWRHETQQQQRRAAAHSPFGNPHHLRPATDCDSYTTCPPTSANTHACIGSSTGHRTTAACCTAHWAIITHVHTDTGAHGTYIGTYIGAPGTIHRTSSATGICDSLRGTGAGIISHPSLTHSGPAENVFGQLDKVRMSSEKKTKGPETTVFTLVDLPDPIFKRIVMSFFDWNRPALLERSFYTAARRTLGSFLRVSHQVHDKVVGVLGLVNCLSEGSKHPEKIMPISDVTGFTANHPIAMDPLASTPQTLHEAVVQGRLEALRVEWLAGQVAMRAYFAALPDIAETVLLRAANTVLGPQTRTAAFIRERLYPLIGRLHCVFASTGNRHDPEHTSITVRVDLPWAEVHANMSAFVERGLPCPVMHELMHNCLQNGRGNLPIFLDLERRGMERCTLRYGLGVDPAGLLGSPDVADAWKAQLGLTALNECWTRPILTMTVPERDGDIPEQSRFKGDVEAALNWVDDPLFALDLANFQKTIWTRPPRGCMNVRQLRRLMYIMGLGPLGDVDAFCGVLFMLCGVDLEELYNRKGPETWRRSRPIGTRERYIKILNIPLIAVWSLHEARSRVLTTQNLEARFRLISRRDRAAVLAVVLAISLFVTLRLMTRFWRDPTGYHDFGAPYCAICQGGKKEPFVAITSTKPAFFIRTGSPRVDKYVSRDIFSRGMWDAPIYRTMENMIQNAGPNCGDGALVVDAGANVGFFGLYAAVSGCRVIAFEIQDRLIDYMKTSVLLNDIPQDRFVMKHVALSDEGGHTVSYSPHPTNLGGTPLILDASGPVKVQTETLANVIPAEKEVFLLKLNVEGHELHVLEGARPLLRRGAIRNIIVETRPDTADLVPLLQGYGYKMFHITEGRNPQPITREAVALLLHQNRVVDLLFIKPREK
ncbi:hypothetical protein PAPYR_5909 [Paratrimastix pyriformis]|uniref:Methyltransferase FkbM domain-containing protein n=1 Tax=Paratrimastix pyriformis TaxID=342808 RepID=A0ABQ8ULJ6_9EUKA|nr:hypothetical protein PAPYR_5909 [Paratrimastix pyriformis]